MLLGSKFTFFRSADSDEEITTGNVSTDEEADSEDDGKAGLLVWTCTMILQMNTPFKKEMKYKTAESP